MFSSIQIKKFRSCNDVTLTDLKEILVLIGRNGAGKTNVLKAIQWVSLFVNGDFDKPTRSMRSLLVQEGEVSLTFDVNGARYTYELRRESVMNHRLKEHAVDAVIEERVFLHPSSGPTLVLLRNGEEVTLAGADGKDPLTFQINATTSALFAIQALFPEKSTYRVWASEIHNFLSGVKYYPLHNFEETMDDVIIPGAVYQKWKSEKKSVPNSLHSLLYTIINMFEERPDSFEELKSLLGFQGIGLISDIEVIAHKFSKASTDLMPDSTPAVYYFVTFKLTHEEDIAHGINALSFGTVRILFLLVSLLYDQATVSLVEQPEDGIHIALVDKLIPLLRSYSINSQFIVASHSSAVMNRADATEIRFVTNERGNTQVRALNTLELSAAQAYLEEDGPLSEFLESIEGT